MFENNKKINQSMKDINTILNEEISKEVASKDYLQEDVTLEESIKSIPTINPDAEISVDEVDPSIKELIKDISGGEKVIKEKKIDYDFYQSIKNIPILFELREAWHEYQEGIDGSFISEVQPVVSYIKECNEEIDNLLKDLNISQEDIKRDKEQIEILIEKSLDPDNSSLERKKFEDDLYKMETNLDQKEDLLDVNLMVKSISIKIIEKIKKINNEKHKIPNELILDRDTTKVFARKIVRENKSKDIRNQIDNNFNSSVRKAALTRAKNSHLEMEKIIIPFLNNLDQPDLEESQVSNYILNNLEKVINERSNNINDLRNVYLGGLITQRRYVNEARDKVIAREMYRAYP